MISILKYNRTVVGDEAIYQYGNFIFVNLFVIDEKKLVE